MLAHAKISRGRAMSKSTASERMSERYRYITLSTMDEGSVITRNMHEPFGGTYRPRTLCYLFYFDVNAISRKHNVQIGGKTRCTGYSEYHLLTIYCTLRRRYVTTHSTNVSVLFIVGPKCTLAASNAGESRCVCQRDRQTDRRTDARSLHYALAQRWTTQQQ